MIDPERLKDVIEIPHPVTKKKLPGFLGMVGFCRLWIPGLGELMKPLTEVTKDEEIEPMTWGLEQEKAFRAIKGALASATALGLPNYIKPFDT